MASLAQVGVINTALGALGQEPVTDLSEASLQASLAATKLMRHVEAARDAVLSRHDFLRARQYVTLPPATVADLVDWRYGAAFLLPGDALQVREIGGEPWSDALPGGWGTRWEVGTLDVAGDGARTFVRAGSSWGPVSIEGGGCALDSLEVAYTRRAAWAALDQPLLDAVAYECAARGAWSVTGDRAVAGDLRKDAERHAQLAIGADGTQAGGQPALSPSIPAAIRNMSR